MAGKGGQWRGRFLAGTGGQRGGSPTRVAVRGVHTGRSRQAVCGLVGEASAEEQTGTGLTKCHLEEDRGSTPVTRGHGRTAQLSRNWATVLLMRQTAERREEGG